MSPSLKRILQVLPSSMPGSHRSPSARDACDEALAIRARRLLRTFYRPHAWRLRALRSAMFGRWFFSLASTSASVAGLDLDRAFAQDRRPALPRLQSRMSYRSLSRCAIYEAQPLGGLSPHLMGGDNRQAGKRTAGLFGVSVRRPGSLVACLCLAHVQCLGRRRAFCARRCCIENACLLRATLSGFRMHYLHSTSDAASLCRGMTLASEHNRQRHMYNDTREPAFRRR